MVQPDERMRYVWTLVSLAISSFQGPGIRPRLVPPLTARCLVGDLDPVAVWVPDVDTNGMAMVRYTLDLYMLFVTTQVG
jgi:hypothetical protein